MWNAKPPDIRLRRNKEAEIARDFPHALLFGEYLLMHSHSVIKKRFEFLSAFTHVTAGCGTEEL
jgi:hypothetical protein